MQNVAELLLTLISLFTYIFLRCFGKAEKRCGYSGIA